MSENRTGHAELAEYLGDLLDYAAIQYRDCPVLDDIVQETMLAALLEIRKNGQIAYPKAYLAQVLRHKYNDWLRNKYRAKEEAYGDLSALNYAVYEENFDAAEEEAEKAREAEHLRREIGRLMAIYRKVIVRYYLHGQSVEKIAEELKIPRGTVMSRLHKGRERLREGMQNMEKYTEASYAPKHMGFSISGSCGMKSEPFSVVDTLIDVNILITAYEKPLSMSDIAGAMGIPCAYLESFVRKLVKNELLGRTSGGLYYTRCHIQRMEEHFGDVDAQEAAARELAEPLWTEIWNTLSGMMEEREVRAMTDKQRVTLLLYYMNRIFSDCIAIMEEKHGLHMRFPEDFPERPNGGRWYASGTVFEDGAKQPKYYGSGPVKSCSRKDVNRRPEYCIWDYQSLFGDAHWIYPSMKYSPDSFGVGHFLASLIPDGTVELKNEYFYELIPEFEKLHILRRDAEGNAVLDIPALPWDVVGRWDKPVKELTERVYGIAEVHLEKLYLAGKTKVPHHVDGRQMYEHEGALGSYVMAQMLAVAEAGLLPYPVEIGKTPVIFLAYARGGRKGDL